MSTLSHLECHSSKCIKGSGYSVTRRRERIGEKARTEGVGDRGGGGEGTKGMTRALKLYFVICQGLLKVQMM